MKIEDLAVKDEFFTTGGGDARNEELGMRNGE